MSKRYLMLYVTLLGVGLLLATATHAQKPYQKPAGTWITISGTVEAVVADAFTLDYGDGTITVEMDDGDRDADAYKLMKDDEVTVTGRIDKNFYDTTTIEAGSVYVENLNTYFYASAVDEEDLYYVTYWPAIAATQTVVTGTVTSANDEEFTLDTGPRQLTVEVEDMAYNPLDDEGYQRIDVGDVVRVAGTMDYDLFEGRELVADAIVTLDW